MNEPSEHRPRKDVMDEDVDVEELGFAPAVSPTGADVEVIGAARRNKLSRPGKRAWRRRASGALVLMVALGGVGGAYTLFATSSGANDTTTSQADIDAGRQLFNTACITCHGANLQGVKDRGPALVGVGSASVYFQVSTGRMPAAGQAAVEPRKAPKFTEQQTDQLGAYVESIGGGPALPQGNLTVGDDKLAEGGELFRLNCAACHGSTGKGAPLSAGKSAPSLRDATDKQILAAMLAGPENMPSFSDNQLTPEQKKAILTYVQKLEASKDPGGNGLDRIGPVSEGLVIWILGIGAMMVVILWIGAKT
jgi:ubiquinol-cytochrome c reductase cytochrome c subunit